MIKYICKYDMVSLFLLAATR